MSRKFRIDFRRSVGNLHIQLSGKFNGMCAWELIKTIKRQPFGAGRVFISTVKLGSVEAGGVHLFKSLMTRSNLPPDWLYFKGERGFEIAPDGSRVLTFKKPGNRQRLRLNTLTR